MAYNYEYPYTDVHRHNDDWMINRVKELSLEWLKTQQEWNNTQEMFTSLKTFIQNYFAELDVQDEVNTKLDIMARDGSLSALISPLFSEYKKEIDRSMSEQNGNISILEARMDAFTALSEGSTTGDAELVDARIDKNGNTHANVGEHIREVTRHLSNDIESVANDNYFAVTNSTMEKGKFINYAGKVEENSEYNYINIPVVKGEKYLVSGYTFSNIPLCNRVSP